MAADLSVVTLSSRIERAREAHRAAQRAAFEVACELLTQARRLQSTAAAAADLDCLHAGIADLAGKVASDTKMRADALEAIMERIFDV